MLKQYFDHNIKPALLTELTAAQESICAAVAWCTDRDILDVLVARANAGVAVEIILNADQINQKTILRLGLTNISTYLYESGSFNSKLHHKFAIVDGKTLLFGSFNWTWRATNRNEEDMTVVRDEPEAIVNFLKKFDQLKRASRLFDSRAYRDARERRIKSVMESPTQPATEIAPPPSQKPARQPSQHIWPVNAGDCLVMLALGVLLTPILGVPIAAIYGNYRAKTKKKSEALRLENEARWREEFNRIMAGGSLLAKEANPGITMVQPRKIKDSVAKTKVITEVKYNESGAALCSWCKNTGYVSQNEFCSACEIGQELYKDGIKSAESYEAELAAEEAENKALRQLKDLECECGDHAEHKKRLDPENYDYGGVELPAAPDWWDGNRQDYDDNIDSSD